MAKKRSVVVSAPGKIILSGEHSVVYGEPALLAAIDRRLFVKISKIKEGMKIIADEPEELAWYAFQKTKEALGEEIKGGLRIKITSGVPVARGMGSSAALAVAMIGALFRYFKRPWDKNLINKIAYQIEKKQHGNPSGCDNSIACFGGFLWFQKRGETFKIKPLKIDFNSSAARRISKKSPQSRTRTVRDSAATNEESTSLRAGGGFTLPDFVLLDSGRARETTGEIVGLVNEKLKTQRSKIKRILDSLGKVTENISDCFKQGNFTLLPGLIKENERLLEELGVVGLKAKEIIRKIEKLGGGAKICGAGGIKEGSGVLLCYHQNPGVILAFAKKRRLTHFPVKLGVQGLKDEKS